MKYQRWTNERVDALLADLKGQRVGDVFMPEGKSHKRVLIDWFGCGCEPQSVLCFSLDKGDTKGCGGCKSKPWTNQRVDALLADLPGQRVGDVFVPEGKRDSRVLIDWFDCDCEPQLVWCLALDRGTTKGCGGCKWRPGSARDVASRAASRAAHLRKAEASLARSNKMKKHKGYQAWLLDVRPSGPKGPIQRWVGYRCPEGHEGEMTLNNYANGKGCPCGKRGIDYTAPGYAYVVAGRGWIKVGICNDHRLEGRLKEHEGQGLTEVLRTVFFDVTHDAKALEDLWKEQRKRIPAERLPTKADIEDGYQEAAPDIHMIRRWIDALLDAVATAA